MLTGERWDAIETQKSLERAFPRAAMVVRKQMAKRRPPSATIDFGFPVVPDTPTRWTVTLGKVIVGTNVRIRRSSW